MSANGFFTTAQSWPRGWARSGLQRSLWRFGRVDLLPGRIRIERGHSLGDIRRVGPKVLFEDLARVIDDEGHHPRVSVFIRIGDEPVSADHLAVDDVVDRPAGRMRSLLGEDLVVVAMVGRVFAGDVALLRRLREKCAQGTLFLSWLSRPIEPVFLVGLTYEVLSKD